MPDFGDNLIDCGCCVINNDFCPCCAVALNCEICKVCDYCANTCVNLPQEDRYDSAVRFLEKLLTLEGMENY